MEVRGMENLTQAERSPFYLGGIPLPPTREVSQFLFDCQQVNEGFRPQATLFGVAHFPPLHPAFNILVGELRLSRQSDPSPR
jgi:hypothetical protein